MAWKTTLTPTLSLAREREQNGKLNGPEGRDSTKRPAEKSDILVGLAVPTGKLIIL
ncbi:MAG: hypothetical protein OEU26_29815 [Candidatus Tectomicrobia bacterium]|nr:hypothetical protein [Candidatus Tectomicrobia bacterium]